MTEEEKKGPSKNELKKLAKQAEKQAKKQQAQGAKDAKKDAGAPAPPAPPKLTICNLDDSVCTKKAVWASRLYGVSLRTSSKSTPMAHGPSLVYGEQVVMGGNSMSKAICLFSGQKVSPEVEEWCEWERTALRHSPDKALPHLEQALAKCGGHHLVNHTTTLADVCIVSTLVSATNKSSYSPLIQAYLQSHEHALQDADKALEILHSLNAPIDPKNPSVNTVLNQVFEKVLRDLFGDDVLESISSKNLVQKCSNPKHGDFQCSASMPIFSHLKKVGNTTYSSPQQVAQALVQGIGSCHEIVMDLSINGPGFIAFRVRPAFLQWHVNEYMKRGHLPVPSSNEVCLVDFSSPNIAKEMHVGHLRSTILGEAICRILEKTGCNVHRVNHVGDWGTQFGMLIQYLKEEYPNFASGEMPNITDLTLFYKNAKKRFDDSPEFKEASRINVVKLQSGDADCVAIWKLLCDISRNEFQKVYNRLDITVEECGESFYNDKIPEVIEEFDKAGLISIEEGGAKCVFCDGYQVPLMLQKSDGGFGYDSTDMTALKYRLQVLKATRIICVTDFTQNDHFKMCFNAAEKIGWLSEHQKLQHIGFGTVMGEDGKRLRTRAGDTVRLVDLLDEAVRRMEESLKARIADPKVKVNISMDEVHKVAEAIGYGAVKYYDLRRNPTSNYKFSYDEMLDTKGNTAVYLLFANARLKSIIAKAKAEHEVDAEELKTEIVIGHPSERNLVLQLQMFTDALALTLDDLFPFHICEYLYNLAIAATDFVTQCKVLGSPEMHSRLLLCRATTMAMRECFDLLGIRHVDRI